MLSVSTDRRQAWGGLLVVSLFCGMGGLFSVSAEAANPKQDPPTGTVRHPVDLRLPGGTRIRALHERTARHVPTRDRVRPARPIPTHKPIVLDHPSRSGSAATAGAQTADASVYLIDSPPLDGFVPHIAVHATDRHRTNDEWDCDPSMTVLGNYLVANPQVNYAIGLYDTGAGVSVLSNANAEMLGLFANDFSTGGTVAIGGVTGTVDAWVSQPFGLWIAGLGSIDEATSTLNTAALVGEWNVSVAMGDEPAPGAPDLATAIGAPMAVYFAASFRNDLPRTVTVDGTTYQGPDITFHSLTDPNIPSYPNRLALELRPFGAADVWYWPCFAVLEYCPGGDGSPTIPTTIIGNSLQSLYFVPYLNLSDGTRTANGMTRFMIDTGAQVTVVGSRVASILGLNPAHSEFTVEIQGVDGTMTYQPGFYVDTLDIPAIGDSLSFTHVPVVMLDVDSPEGGTLDGIIGMNLLTRYNFVFRGGGMSGQPQPWLEFAPIPVVDFDYDNDGDIDMTDFGHLQLCLTDGTTPPAYCSDVLSVDADSDIGAAEVDRFILCASGPGTTAPAECRGE